VLDKIQTSKGQIIDILQNVNHITELDSPITFDESYSIMNKELQANYTEANLENLFDFADENLVTISEALLESFNILAEKHLNEYINKRVNISKHLLVMDQN